MLTAEERVYVSTGAYSSKYSADINGVRCFLFCLTNNNLFVSRFVYLGLLILRNKLYVLNLNILNLIANGKHISGIFLPNFREKWIRLFSMSLER